MWRYILKRLVWTIVIMLCVTVLIFTITYFIPGDPARVMLGSLASDAEVANMRVVLGLDRSYLEQLTTYLGNLIFHLDFGISWTYNVPVVQELFSRLPLTILVGGIAMLIQIVLGIPLGVFAATHQSKWQDYMSIGISMILVSLPDFWVALMLVLLFSVKLGWLPAYGIDGWTCFIMPIIATSISGIAMNARQARSAVLEVFRADYISTARAKGQVERKVIWKHMFPNAMMPIITIVVSGLTRIVGGTAIIENIFSIPGVGQYMLNGINSMDFPVIRGSVVVLSLFSALSVLLMDLVYAFVDPRIKAQYAGGKRR